MSALTVGVDLGGTKIQAAAVRDEDVAGTFRVPTPQSGAADVAAAIVEAAKQAVTEAGATVGDVTGVGIGAPGTIDTAAGTVSTSPNLPGFQGNENVPLGEMVSKGLGGTPVKLDNDVRVAILGEWKRGAGRGYRNLLGVWVGTGVGGGLILDGKLFQGQGAAGEIGHTIVKPGGRVCSDGRKGHLEAYAGRGQMEAEARRRTKDGKKTALFRSWRARAGRALRAACGPRRSTRATRWLRSSSTTACGRSPRGSHPCRTFSRWRRSSSVAVSAIASASRSFAASKSRWRRYCS